MSIENIIIPKFNMEDPEVGTKLNSFLNDLKQVIEEQRNVINVAIDKGIKPLVGAKAYRVTSNQSNIVNCTDTKVQLNGESYDLGADFDSSNNYRFIAPVSGYYQVNGAILYASVVANKRYYCIIKKNNSSYCYNQSQAAYTSTIGSHTSDVIYLAATDYIELFAYHNAGVNTVDIVFGAVKTYMSVFLLSIA